MTVHVCLFSAPLCLFAHVIVGLNVIRLKIDLYTSLRFVYVQQLNNRLFEELAMDVYDEVDRRENDAGEPHLVSSIMWKLETHVSFSLYGEKAADVWEK